jgi:hypothetical protein
MTSVAPAVSVIAISEIDASKLSDASCSTRDVALMPSRSICAAASVAMPACETTTPFGFPVEPEV